MKKIFLLIITFLFFFSFVILVEAKDCDWFPSDFNNFPCGNWAGCSDADGQSKCHIDCQYSYEFPKCDCKTGEPSNCWCECVDTCAVYHCRNFAFSTGICEEPNCTDKPYVTGKCKKNKSEPPDCYFYNKEEDCSDGEDDDNDGKIDCEDIKDCPEGTSCGGNKVCKGGDCVEKLPACPGNCEWITTTCWCGENKIETDSAQFCCSALNIKYSLQEDCLAECRLLCLEGCENQISGECYCGKKIINTGYCFNGRGYNNQDECKKAEEAAASGEEPPAGWIFTCPGKETYCPPGALCMPNPLCAESVEDLINDLIDFIFYFSIVFAPIMFIIAGFLFVTAAGVPEKIQRAKNVVMWTAVGLAVIILAKGIIEVIQNIFQKVD